MRGFYARSLRSPGSLQASSTDSACLLRGGGAGSPLHHWLVSFWALDPSLFAKLRNCKKGEADRILTPVHASTGLWIAIVDMRTVPSEHASRKDPVLRRRLRV